MVWFGNGFLGEKFHVSRYLGFGRYFIIVNINFMAFCWNHQYGLRGLKASLICKIYDFYDSRRARRLESILGREVCVSPLQRFNLGSSYKGLPVLSPNKGFSRCLGIVSPTKSVNFTWFQGYFKVILKLPTCKELSNFTWQIT